MRLDPFLEYPGHPHTPQFLHARLFGSEELEIALDACFELKKTGMKAGFVDMETDLDRF